MTSLVHSVHQMEKMAVSNTSRGMLPIRCSKGTCRIGSDRKTDPLEAANLHAEMLCAAIGERECRHQVEVNEAAHHQHRR